MDSHSVSVPTETSMNGVRDGVW